MPDFASRSHFLRIATRVMRQVLVDHARARLAAKRNALLTTPLLENVGSKSVDADVMELNDATEALGKEDERLLHIVEMRFLRRYDR